MTTHHSDPRIVGKAPRIHYCDLPKPKWYSFKGFELGTLAQCQECKKTWVWDYKYDSQGGYYDWVIWDYKPV